MTEADLERLPSSVAAYVRQSGALGQPSPVTFRARFHGRIRTAANGSTMPSELSRPSALDGAMNPANSVLKILRRQCAGGVPPGSHPSGVNNGARTVAVKEYGDIANAVPERL